MERTDVVLISFTAALRIKRVTIMKPLSSLHSEWENSLGQERVSGFLNVPRAHTVSLRIDCRGEISRSPQTGRVAIAQPRLTKADLMSERLMRGDLIVLLKLFIAFIC